MGSFFFLDQGGMVGLGWLGGWVVGLGWGCVFFFL